MSGGLSPLSPSDGVDGFIASRTHLRESSLQNVRHRMSVFLDWCDEYGVDNLNSLTGRDLHRFVSWRRDDVAPITLQKQLTSVRQALRYWADIEAVPEGIAEKLHAPELPDGAHRSDDVLDADHAREIRQYLERYEYASRRHAVFVLMWQTGMRRSAVRSLDVADMEPDDEAVRLEHRPDSGTKLKNGADGNRWVYLGNSFDVIAEYVETHRHELTDDAGREPLITTKYGRPTGDTYYGWVCQLTHEIGPCDGCPADRGEPASRCPDSVGPHGIRRGSITHHLNHGVSPEICSERMDVSLDTLYQHYDARTERERMDVRKDELPS